jgi:hypothetical protein
MNIEKQTLSPPPNHLIPPHTPLQGSVVNNAETTFGNLPYERYLDTTSLPASSPGSNSDARVSTRLGTRLTSFPQFPCSQKTSDKLAHVKAMLYILGRMFAVEIIQGKLMSTSAFRSFSDNFPSRSFPDAFMICYIRLA